MKELIQSEIGDIKKYQTTHYFTDGSWSLFELIEHCLDYVPPSYLYISSYSISEEAVRSFHQLQQEGKIKGITAMVDSSLRKTKTHVLYFAMEVFDAIKVTPNHSKLIIFENPDFPLMINASANLSRNRRIETGIIISDEIIQGYYLEKFIDHFNNFAIDV